ncbi:phage tail protein [Enterobacter sp. CGMCC 5087]|uniref:phage tail tube protein n=1 Tax=Enterobacter sp. CGMCC 5087 TaxID=2183878 RepID=UPI000D680752|nr:phage tail tube protein [Enterobacter sp. CGMCC 5087]PWI81123.1 phage tail protein [Enterobacter sp. CGMCC 5087]
MSDNLLAGTAYVSVDGSTIMVGGQFKYATGRVKRETLIGMDGIHGYKETFVAPYISCQVRDAGNTVLSDYNNMTNVTLVVELANGKTLTGSGMWTTDPQEVDSEEALFTVKWEGMTGSVKES